MLRPGMVEEKMIQKYEERIQALLKPHQYKVRKILEYGCLDRINPDLYHCNPIVGYNKTVYHLTRDPHNATFKCSCQGFNKKGSCSHQQALLIKLSSEGIKLERTLF